MRIEMMNCLMDNLSMAETIERVEEFIASGEPHQHVVVNVDKIVKANRDPELRNIINGCPLISVDGMPLLWAAKILGKPIKERVTGIDLFTALVEEAAHKRWRIYFLGAREEVVRRVVDQFQDQYPTLEIAGWRNGYWTPAEEKDIVDSIRSSRPDILFVAISSPRKEQFLGAHSQALSIPFAMGVGGSFDVISGKIRRAPRIMQNLGLEWFFRFLQEPRRMFRRYFIDDLYFLVLLWRDWRKKAR